MALNLDPGQTTLKPPRYTPTGYIAPPEDDIYAGRTEDPVYDWTTDPNADPFAYGTPSTAYTVFDTDAGRWSVNNELTTSGGTETTVAPPPDDPGSALGANYSGTWDAERGMYVYRPNIAMGEDIAMGADGQTYVKLTDSDGVTVDYELYENPNDKQGLDTTANMINLDDPNSVWSGVENTVNEFSVLISEALAGLDMDYSSEQNIMDILKTKILNQETPLIDYGSIDDVLADIAEGPDEAEAFDFVAKAFGFDSSTEYFQYLAETRGMSRSDMEGLTAEEKSEYQRMARMDVADQERRSLAQMEAVFANTGSSIQYMAAADEANQRLVNIQAKYNMEILNQDIALQGENLDRELLKASEMVQQGAISAMQYMEMREQGYMNLLNGYLGKGNLQLAESANDRAIMESQINAVYNSMMIQTGINEGILNTVNSAFETSMAPLMSSLNTLLAKENLDAQDAATAMGWVGTLLEGVGSFFEIG